MWTPELVAETLRLQSEGQTGSQIADALSAITQKKVTRNAVIGKLHRVRGYDETTKQANRVEWTPEREAQLIAVWPTVITLAQVSALMGGINRSALGIKGKVLGLSPKNKNHYRPSRAGQGRTRSRRPRKAPILGMRDLPPEESPNAIPFMGAGRWHCRWPMGEPTYDMLVCGAWVEADKPYCPYHCGRAFDALQVMDARAINHLAWVQANRLARAT